MSIAQFVVPPVIKTVTVRAAPERAFSLFADIGSWWPLARVHTGPDPQACAIEPRVGGRVFERAADGRETAWGIVLAYEPPHRLAFSWLVQSAEQPQLVEIRFTPEPDGTRVELTHSGWEKLGEAAGAASRERYDRGWVLVFEQCFAEYAKAAT